MNIDRRLIWIAPLLAMVVVLGPLAVDSGTAKAATQDSIGRTVSRSTLPTTPATTPQVGDRLPEFPSLLEVGGALLLVCGVGAAALWVLAKLKRGNGTPWAGSLLGGAAQSSAAGPISLRQSVRLSPRATVHAVEFDGRLLLIGEGEHGPCLLEDSQVAADAHDLARRDLEDGVDLLDTREPRARQAAPRTSRTTTIPRPPAPAPRRTAPAVLSDFEEVLRTARAGQHQEEPSA